MSRLTEVNFTVTNHFNKAELNCIIVISDILLARCSAVCVILAPSGNTSCVQGPLMITGGPGYQAPPTGYSGGPGYGQMPPPGYGAPPTGYSQYPTNGMGVPPGQPYM